MLLLFLQEAAPQFELRSDQDVLGEIFIFACALCVAVALLFRSLRRKEQPLSIVPNDRERKQP